MIIKKCPFCNSHNVSFQWYQAINDHPIEGAIECEECQAIGPVEYDDDNCKIQAIESWNTRHPSCN